jgi:DNA-binding MarR family transcriptional regulator
MRHDDDPHAGPSALTDHLGYWLRAVSNHVSHAFKAKVEAQGVTVAEWVVLRALFDADGLHQHELADKLGLTRGAISKLVDRLVAKGLLSCTPSTKDRRYQHLALTEAGKALVPPLCALADQNDADHFGHLTEPERAALLALLQGIAQRKGLRGAPIE